MRKQFPFKTAARPVSTIGQNIAGEKAAPERIQTSRDRSRGVPGWFRNLYRSLTKKWPERGAGAE